MSVAHDIPAAGHLGVAKTKDRLLRHFYWPSINKDVKEFGRSCDVCQRLGKGAVSPPAPLHSLPPVSEPFCQTTLGVHHIELLPNAQPIRSAPYRLHPEKDEFVRKEFKNSDHISSVLSDLFKNRSRFEWTKEADAAYLDLRPRLAT